MLSILFAAIALAGPVDATPELSLYGGAQSTPNSQVSGAGPGSVGPFDFLAGWENRRFSIPPYFGVRLTWWQNTDWAWGVDFSHDMISANAETLSDNSISALNFVDGLNILTVNRYRRWRDFGGHFVPYLGAGLGVSLPSLDIDSGAGTTSGIQLGGPAVAVVAGARYPVSDRWSIFGEYKGTYSVNNTDLVSGGELNANIFTNSVNLGAVLGF